MIKDTPEIRSMKYDIKQFISSIGYMEATMIKDETLIFQDCLIESIGLIQLVTFLEEKFGIQTTDSDLIEENFESVNAIVNLIQQKISAV